MDFFFRISLENQGNGVDTVYLNFSKVSGGVSHDVDLKDELTFKYWYLCVQGTWQHGVIIFSVGS